MRQNFYFLDFFQRKTNDKPCKDDFTKYFFVHEIAALLGGDTQKQKIVQIAFLSNNFDHWNLSNRKTFFFCF